MEVKAGFLVVAKIREHASVDVNEIGPVWVVHAGIQNDQTWRIPTANGSETAFIAGTRNQLAQNIVCGIAFCVAFVTRIDHKVGVRQR